MLDHIDPRGAELNQAWLKWSGHGFGTTFGRQRLLIDNPAALYGFTS